MMLAKLKSAVVAALDPERKMLREQLFYAKERNNELSERLTDECTSAKYAHADLAGLRAQHVETLAALDNAKAAHADLPILRARLAEVLDALRSADMELAERRQEGTDYEKAIADMNEKIRALRIANAGLRDIIASVRNALP